MLGPPGPPRGTFPAATRKFYYFVSKKLSLRSLALSNLRNSISVSTTLEYMMGINKKMMPLFDQYNKKNIQNYTCTTDPEKASKFSVAIDGAGV